MPKRDRGNQDGPRRPVDFDAARRIFVEIESEPVFEPSAAASDVPHIEGYLLNRLLGRGGGGEVYHALREGTERAVAIKLLSRELGGSKGSKRAWRELHMLSELRLSCLPAVHDYGEQDGRLYIVTDYIEGEILTAFCESHALDRRARVKLLIETAKAVQSLHEYGVIHRDIKPDNIIVNQHGQPMIIDLGIAALMTDDVMQTITADGAPIGSPAYMSPEQAKGERKKISTRSDVYSLGATAYMVLTGETPHDMSTTLHEAVRRVAQDEPRDPRELDDTLPKPLAAVLAKAVARNPDRRYESAASLGADLQRWLDGDPVEAKPVKGLAWVKLTIKKQPLTAAAFAIAFLIVGTSIPFIVEAIRNSLLPVIITLDSADPEQGFVIKGDKAAAQFSVSGTFACDFNGDEYPDIVSGVPGRPNMSGETHLSGAGSVFIRFGRPDDRDGSTIESMTIGYESGMLIEGVYEQAKLGFDLGAIGDVDGDGIDDIALYSFAEGGIPPNADEGEAQVYVLFGSAEYGPSYRLTLDALPADRGLIITSLFCHIRANLDLFQALGDINDDDVDDFAFSETVSGTDDKHPLGAVHVVLGHSGLRSLGTLDLAAATTTQVITIEEIQPGSGFGHAVGSIGDLNGDGRRELVISAPHERRLDREAGVVYIVFTTDDFLLGQTNLQLDRFTREQGFCILGEEDYDWLGWSLDGVGDVNGDGIEDMLIGNYQIANPTTDAGKCYLLFGYYLKNPPSLIDLRLLTGQQGVIFQAPPKPLNFGDHFGVCVTRAGDLNGDGLQDFAMQALRARGTAPLSGVVYLIFGSSSFGEVPMIPVSSSGTHYGITIYGEYGGAHAGTTLGAGGDVNGDGLDDLLIGAPLSSPDGKSLAGQVHVFYGGRN